VIEELKDERYKDRVVPYYYGFRDLAYGWDMFMENVMDPAHVPVSHHGIIGSRYKDAKPLLMNRIQSLSEIPISEGGQYDPSHPQDAGFAFEVRQTNETQNPATNDFRPPVLQKITSYLPNGAKFILALYATPTRPGFCRHIGTQILIKGEDMKAPPGLGFYAFPLPKWLLHPLASLFLHQDMVFLHHQERILHQQSQYAFGDFQQVYNLTSSPAAYSANYFMPNPHDKMISSLRQWIFSRAGGGPKWGKAALARGLPPRLSDEELFDVYNSHSKHCTICMDSIKNMKRLKYLSAGLAIISAVLLRGWKAIVAGSIFTLSSAFFHQFSKLYFKYSFHHQDNN
jgi:phenylpropionate dioxygenase-like ring-hydroxylating dioxygenase large terminal subunit